MAEHELNKIVDDDGEVFNLRDSTKQPTADRVTSWSSTTSDTKYPSEKLVKDSLDGKQATLSFDGTYNASTNKAATVSTVTNAINGLDVSSVGGNGKYISAISETDGKISATATTMDTTPTADSTNAVTSGGIKTALDGKMAIYTSGSDVPSSQNFVCLQVSCPYVSGVNKTQLLLFDVTSFADGTIVNNDAAYVGFSGFLIGGKPQGGGEKICVKLAAKVAYSQITTSSGFRTLKSDSATCGPEIVKRTENGVDKYYLSIFYDSTLYSGNNVLVGQFMWRKPTNIDVYSYSNGVIGIYYPNETYPDGEPLWERLQSWTSNIASQKLFTARKLKTNLARTADSTFDGSADQTNIPVTGTLPLGNGGTGKTTAKAAEYNLTTGKSEISDTTSGDDRVVFELASPSESNGVTRGFRKLSTIWTWIKGLLSSESGVNISGNAATATKATKDSDGNAINATYFKSSGNTTLVAGAATKIGTQNGTDVKLTLPTIPAAVRVKGNAESSYRTGDVNLTPANIGLTDAAIRGKISAGTDLSYDSSTGVMKVNTTGTASGNYAFASGLATTASGNYSNAEGYKTTASSTSSHAEGSQTAASTPAAHAEGYKTTASGISAHAEGYRDDGDEFIGFSVASGLGSHIEGIDTKASDDASHAEGYLTESSGPHAHAEGEATLASGKDSHAEGLWSTASGLCSHAENSSFAYGENAHSEGYGQSSWGAVGVASHTEGSAAFAYGMSAHAEGGGTNALGKDSHAEGLGGGYRPVAITLTANHVAETSTFTGSTEGLSVGMYLLWKDDAHLTQQVSKITWIGNGTFGTQATFDSAIPAGTVVYAVDRGVAAGAASHVEGFGTSAVGMYSHAEGYLTKAIGEASHAEGQGTEARTGGMHAAGMYPATKEGFARVTGWGSAASPKDIERLSTQGVLWVSDHFYGATPLKVVPGQTTYDEIYEAWSEQRPFVIEVSMLTHMAHAIYAPAIIRAVPLDQAMDHWEFHFRVDYPYNYRAAFYAGGQEPYKVSVYYLAINEQQGWGKLVSGSNEWASLSDSRWYSVPVEYAALAETATEAQNAAASSPLANAINGKSDVGHKHPISDLTMGILPASLGGTGQNTASSACKAFLVALGKGSDNLFNGDRFPAYAHSGGAVVDNDFTLRSTDHLVNFLFRKGLGGWDYFADPSAGTLNHDSSLKEFGYAYGAVIDSSSGCYGWKIGETTVPSASNSSAFKALVVVWDFDAPNWDHSGYSGSNFVGIVDIVHRRMSDGTTIKSFATATSLVPLWTANEDGKRGISIFAKYIDGSTYAWYIGRNTASANMNAKFTYARLSIFPITEHRWKRFIVQVNSSMTFSSTGDQYFGNRSSIVAPYNSYGAVGSAGVPVYVTSERHVAACTMSTVFESLTTVLNDGSHTGDGVFTNGTHLITSYADDNGFVGHLKPYKRPASCMWRYIRQRLGGSDDTSAGIGIDKIRTDSSNVLAIVNSGGSVGGTLSAANLRATNAITKSDTFIVTKTDVATRGNGQLYFYRNTHATNQILAKWHTNSTSTYASGYIQPGCTGVFQLINETNDYFSRIS